MLLLCYTICVVFVRCPATRFDSQISVKEWFSERCVLVVRDSRHRLDRTTGVIRRSIAIHSWIIMIRTLPNMIPYVALDFTPRTCLGSVYQRLGKACVPKVPDRYNKGRCGHNLEAPLLGEVQL